jgi:topoisomerase-4 subunit B
MTTTKHHNYDEDKIKSLSSLEHIRKRTGMYIGRVGDGSDYDDGIYILLKEIVDNAVDEYIMGYGDRIAITLDGTKIIVRDYGRGIPLGKVVECVSRINTGAKYSDEVFQFSVGLNGIGTKAVNALSSSFTVRSFRGGEFAGAVFERGKLLEQLKGKISGEPDGTLVSFDPDPDIFGSASFAAEHVERRLQLYAFLNCGLRIEYNGRLFATASSTCCATRWATRRCIRRCTISRGHSNLSSATRSGSKKHFSLSSTVSTPPTAART